MSLYGHYREQARKEHPSRISGNDSCLICAVSTAPLGSAAANALTKSFEALGYGPDPVTFVTLQAADSSHVGMVPDNQDPKDCLTGKELFGFLEALDPVIVVCCDGVANKKLAEAYRCSFPALVPYKLFGRFACSFPDLGRSLESDKGKQQVWSLLKRLPRRQ